MAHQDINEKIQDILNNRISGSTFIAGQIETIFPFIPEDRFNSVIKAFIHTHSSMAAVLNRINYLCLKREGHKFSRKKGPGKKVFADFWNENALKKKWISLSMSYWIIECFKYNRERLDIKVGISYPDREGLSTYDLLKNHHQVEIHEDSRLAVEVRDADGILLGADLIADDVVINKTGSFSLAAAARYFKKPLFIISSGDKVLSDDLLPLFRMKSSEENSRIIHYFDPVPAELIKKIYLTTPLWDFPLSDTLREITGMAVKKKF